MPPSVLSAATPYRPLAGLRVLVTRPEGEGAEEWAVALAAAGAVPIRYPTIAIAPPASWRPLDAALDRLGSYRWLIFTSQTTVAFVLTRLPGRQFPAAAGPRIAAVGPATARAIEAAGGMVGLLPEDHRQEGLIRAFAAVPAKTPVLLPIAEDARTLLAEGLRSQGCVVDVVTAYRTLARLDLPALPAFDVATFASPSALRAFVARAGSASLAGRGVAVIGVTTAAEAAASGIQAVVAESSHIEALVSAIAKSRSPQGGEP